MVRSWHLLFLVTASNRCKCLYILVDRESTVGSAENRQQASDTHSFAYRVTGRMPACATFESSLLCRSLKYP